ncbi:MAG: hypothetical protein GC162_08690 [Planctomycetes bacterium]|nr:hypothetical protein [Planctomycetota bacterium]
MIRIHAIVLIIALNLGAAAAQASLIQNGDFESSPNLTNWTVEPNSGAITTTSVISGAKSLIINDTNAGAGVSQSFTGQAEVVIKADFAVFASTVEGARTFNMTLRAPDNTLRMNLRVVLDNGNQALQAYNGSAFVNLGSLTANTTVDVGDDHLWSAAESIVINTLVVHAHMAPSGSNYDVTLNNQTVTGLSLFQFNPTTTNFKIGNVRFQNFSTTDSPYLVDNVSVNVIPTPAALPAGLAMMGLLTMRRRK